jgi:hypothetical protein
MPFEVSSEVGKLRKVMVHRPGLEHTRLTPVERRRTALRRCAVGQPGPVRARRVLRRHARTRRGSLRSRAVARRGAHRPRGRPVGLRSHPERARSRRRGRSACPGVGRVRAPGDGGRVPDRRHVRCRGGLGAPGPRFRRSRRWSPRRPGPARPGTTRSGARRARGQLDAVVRVRAESTPARRAGPGSSNRVRQAEVARTSQPDPERPSWPPEPSAIGTTSLLTHPCLDHQMLMPPGASPGSG